MESRIYFDPPRQKREEEGIGESVRFSMLVLLETYKGNRKEIREKIEVEFYGEEKIERSDLFLKVFPCQHLAIETNILDAHGFIQKGRLYLSHLLDAIDPVKKLMNR